MCGVALYFVLALLEQAQQRKAARGGPYCDRGYKKKERLNMRSDKYNLHLRAKTDKIDLNKVKKKVQR